jgi:hypothetical protein
MNFLVQNELIFFQSDRTRCYREQIKPQNGPSKGWFVRKNIGLLGLNQVDFQPYASLIYLRFLTFSRAGFD